MITEGLLIYLTADDVEALARDLAAPPSFQRWILDLTSPALLRMLQERMAPLDRAAPLKFAPPDGPAFFARTGWRPLEVRGLLMTAAGLKRLPLRMRLFALFPDSAGRGGSRPWGGVCLMER